MNRRTFIAGSTAVLALTPSSQRIYAQDTETSEARWDDTSQIYGNAWDLLPKAKEGEIELLNTIVSPAGPEFGLTSLYGLIHNNSKDAAGLTKLEFKSGDLTFMTSTYQSIIAPQAYALVCISTTLDLSSESGPLMLNATFGSAEEVQALHSYIPGAALQVSSAEITNDGVKASITNAGGADIKDAGIGGALIWFDDHGLPVNGATIGDLEGLPAGESRETESYIFADFDIAAPYLIGYCGYTE